MLFLLQQYQEVILTLLKKLFKKNLFIFIGIYYPYRKRGKPILLHLLCCDPFAVDNHSCMGHASPPLILGWGGGSRFVNNPGLLIRFIKKA